MNFCKRLLTEEDGQGLSEYALIVFFIVFFFWVGMKNTDIGDELVSIWDKVKNCVGAPFSCSA
jgi:Flp pilus assembly pilin Flp